MREMPYFGPEALNISLIYCHKKIFMSKFIFFRIFLLKDRFPGPVNVEPREVYAPARALRTRTPTKPQHTLP